MIRVLIVEDSPVAQELLAHILSADLAIEVVGIVANGKEALEAVRDRRPDIITMDIHMPKMDGFEATRRIMENLPTPIVIVSASAGAKEVSSTFRAIEVGALAVVRRPAGIGHPDYESQAKELVQTVKLMSEVKVVRRFSPRIKVPVRSLPLAPPAPKALTGIEIAAIGASTGGPLALETILSGLPQGLSIPLLIVQHIAAGFGSGFAEWLSGACDFPVYLGSHGERALPGRAYIAPDGFHMGVDAGGRIALSDHPPEHGLRPSVGHLFRTVGRVFGSHAVAVLLTGMGKDGAEELKMMRHMGAITVAQNEESCIVYGMPGEAVKLDAATHVLSPEQIVQLLVNMGGKKEGQSVSARFSP